MNNFLTVFKFELKEFLRKKSFVMTTIIMAILVLAITIVPMFFFNSESEKVQPTTDTFFTNAGFNLSVLNESDQEMIKTLLKLQDDQLYTDNDALRNDVKAEKINVGYAVKDPLDFETIFFNRNFDADGQTVFSSILQNVYRSNEYAKLGVDVNRIQQIQDAQVNNKVTILGRDSLNNFFITYILNFAVYMIVILYGQMAATGIAREKADRTMELLVTSVKPVHLITGKVAAIGLGTLFQVFLILVAGIIGFNIAKHSYPSDILMFLQSSFTWDMIFIFAFFYLGGYILYLFVFAALGSLVSRVEDVNATMTPIMMLIILAVFASIYSLNDINGLLAKSLSIFPFTSFLVMPTRYLLTIVPSGELLLSMGLMVLFIGLIAYLSTIIYRFGTLHYGNKMGFFKSMIEVFKRR